MEIHVVNASNSEQYSDVLTAMFRRRYDVFIKEKGWNLPNISKIGSGEERDIFDEAPGASHLITIENGEYIGSHRLLPSTGPHLASGPLKDKYWDIAPAPVGPEAWELSRGIFTPVKRYPNTPLAISCLTVGMIEWAVELGISTIFGVIGQEWLPAMLETGWELQYHSYPVAYPEGGYGLGVSWPVTAQTLATTRERRGIDVPVLARERTRAGVAA